MLLLKGQPLVRDITACNDREDERGPHAFYRVAADASFEMTYQRLGIRKAQANGGRLVVLCPRVAKHLEHLLLPLFTDSASCIFDGELNLDLLVP